MRKVRTSKIVPKADADQTASSAPGFPIAILDEASKEFSFEVTSLQISPSGVILLIGWTDDRLSKLRQVRLQGQNWSKVIDSQYIGRHRRADVEGSLVTPQQRFFGFWAFTAH